MSTIDLPCHHFEVMNRAHVAYDKSYHIRSTSRLLHCANLFATHNYHPGKCHANRTIPHPRWMNDLDYLESNRLNCHLKILNRLNRWAPLPFRRCASSDDQSYSLLSGSNCSNLLRNSSIDFRFALKSWCFGSGVRCQNSLHLDLWAMKCHCHGAFRELLLLLCFFLRVQSERCPNDCEAILKFNKMFWIDYYFWALAASIFIVEI